MGLDENYVRMRDAAMSALKEWKGGFYYVEGASLEAPLRKFPYPYLRLMVARRLYYSGEGYTLDEIAKKLGRTHCTLSTGMRILEDVLEYDNRGDVQGLYHLFNTMVDGNPQWALEGQNDLAVLGAILHEAEGLRMVTPAGKKYIEARFADEKRRNEVH